MIGKPKIKGLKAPKVREEYNHEITVEKRHQALVKLAESRIKDYKKVNARMLRFEDRKAQRKIRSIYRF